ncbi:MAG TPA: helix-turn-helix domain-containing protein [Trebonia sp.]|nr:helix-turn-helix domain-containing protein [Trebonia sp.]
MTPALTLVERKRRQARQRIIEAARELFLERGFDDVSVGDIAERAEVGRTTFFRYFGDKQEVVFALEEELLETITAAAQADDTPAARNATEAVEQLRPILLALCAQATADPEAYTRHFQLIDQHPELRARDAVKMQQIAGKLSDLLVHRGSDEATAVFAAQVALACYQTAKRLGNNPRTLVDETRAAFGQALALGADAAETEALSP